MDYEAQLETLKKRVDDTLATVKAAAGESRDKLEARIDKAQVDINLAIKDADQRAAQAKGTAQSKWTKARADAAAKMDDLKAKAAARQSLIDSDRAASDAQASESDAEAAISFANWAVDNARAAILDALDAAAYSAQMAEMAIAKNK
jgi:hypothetical protein